MKKSLAIAVIVMCFAAGCACTGCAPKQSVSDGTKGYATMPKAQFLGVINQHLGGANPYARPSNFAGKVTPGVAPAGQAPAGAH